MLNVLLAMRFESTRESIQRSIPINQYSYQHCKGNIGFDELLLLIRLIYNKGDLSTAK
jgi:hypothetical protein